jgi:hypothetical protein
MDIIIVVFALSIIGFLIHFFSTKKPRTVKRAVELLLLYQLIFNIGVMSFIAFLAQSFAPEVVAQNLEWPTCPFQQEMANVNLGFSILGFMSIWFRGHFWTATVIGSAIWLFGDGIHHAIYLVDMGTYTIGSGTALFFSDIITPIFMVILLVLYLRIFKPKRFH